MFFAPSSEFSSFVVVGDSDARYQMPVEDNFLILLHNNHNYHITPHNDHIIDINLPQNSANLTALFCKDSRFALATERLELVKEAAHWCFF